LNKVITVLAIIGLFLVLVPGCMEEPNPVGARLLPPSDLLKLDTTTVVATKSATERVVPNTSTPLSILVGKTSDYESWALLRFTPIPDTLLFVNVIDAKLDLRVNYHFGDSLAPFSLDVHKVLTSWGGDSLTIDSLNVAGLYEPTPNTSFAGSAIGDTATISIPLDTAMVRQWLDSPLDTVATNWGVLLKPTNSSVIKGFATSISSNASFRPQLVARYQRAGSTRIDTVRVSGSSEAFAAFAENTSWLGDSTRMYIHNGIASRGMVDFDISSLPAKSTIHKAVLEVTLDAALSRFNSHTRDSLFAFFVGSDGVFTSLAAVSEPATTNGQKVYRIAVTQFVQLWSRSDEPQRIALAGFAEDRALDSFVLYGATTLFRPKLIITYSPVQ